MQIHLKFSSPFDEYMAEVLGVSPEAVRGYAADFERLLLVYLTGWDLETIDRMGVQDAARVLGGIGALREYLASKRRKR